MENEISWKKVEPLIEATLNEDFGEIGDLTTDCIIARDMKGKGEFVVRTEGIVAGLPVTGRVFEKVDDNLKITLHLKDGSKISPGMVLCTVEGSVSSILRAERTALNFLQRLSGIATLTNRFIKAVHGTGVKILDTRKTSPQLRLLEKYAVRKGGGENHRFGLYDMVLIKDNHIDASGGITSAVERCLACLKSRRIEVPVEVECRTLEDVREAAQLPIHRIMLDNMDIDKMRTAVEEVKGGLGIEASGNVNLENVRAIAETGVDYISVGALTHSVKALDISLIVST